jgi:small subunit ribosomal protein S2
METVKNPVEKLLAVGAHFAHAKARRHPSAKPFILGIKGRVEIFDLEKTNEKLEHAKSFAESLGSEGKTILFVGAKNEARHAVREAAETIGMPFVNLRWIGGTITNFGEVKKRMERLESLIEQKEKGELAKYTKKERLLIDREIAKLKKLFGGIVSLKKIPDALFVVDTKREHIVIEEAAKKKLPIIGLISSDCDMTGVSHPIPANDASIHSISYIAKEIASAYKQGISKKA